MYAQKFYKLKTFPFYTTIKEWGKKKVALWRVVCMVGDMGLLVIMVWWLHYQA
jgi:hypothetical protein